MHLAKCSPRAGESHATAWPIGSMRLTCSLSAVQRHLPHLVPRFRCRQLTVIAVSGYLSGDSIRSTRLLSQAPGRKQCTSKQQAGGRHGCSSIRWYDKDAGARGGGAAAGGGRGRGGGQRGK